MEGPGDCFLSCGLGVGPWANSLQDSQQAMEGTAFSLYRVLKVSMEEVPEKVKLMMVYYHCTNDVEGREGLYR